MIRPTVSLMSSHFLPFATQSVSELQSFWKATVAYGGRLPKLAHSASNSPTVGGVGGDGSSFTVMFTVAVSVPPLPSLTS